MRKLSGKPSVHLKYVGLYYSDKWNGSIYEKFQIEGLNTFVFKLKGEYYASYENSFPGNNVSY